MSNENGIDPKKLNEMIVKILRAEQANLRTREKTTDEMVDAGVKGIMNFTPIRLSAPADVRVQNVDLATELQTLIYFLDSDKEN